MGEGSTEQWQRADDEVRKKLPPGVKLLRTLRGHTDRITRISWSPDGQLLATPSADSTIMLWDAESGECLHTLKGHENVVYCVDFDPKGYTLASGSSDHSIKLWDIKNGRCIRTIKEDRNYTQDSWYTSVRFHPTRNVVAISSPNSASVRLLDNDTNKLHSQQQDLVSRVELRSIQPSPICSGINEIAFDQSGLVLANATTEGVIILDAIDANCKGLLYKRGNHGVSCNTVAFKPREYTLAVGYENSIIEILEPKSARLCCTMEGHTGPIICVSFSSDGKLVGSLGGANDGSLRLWNSETGVCLATILEPSSIYSSNYRSFAFHPRLPILASVGSDFRDLGSSRHDVVHIYELDLAILLNKYAETSIAYTSAKIVLVGDSGVGKTGLGWRLAHGEFKEHSSTHGQQFWLLNQLCKQRSDGAQCEAVLWDLAGQPDYRLIHALFLDDADLALVLFDPTNDTDSLNSIEFWLKHLKVEARSPMGTPIILIAARSDRGTPRLTEDEMKIYCMQKGIDNYLLTSAKSGEGIDELIRKMNMMIPWDAKPTTITTETFKRIKDFVLDLKENSRRRKVILNTDELCRRLKKTDSAWKFSIEEMLIAVGHLANHGFVTKLRTSQVEQRILLSPELLNNLAASFVLEARRNQKGLGSLEEQLLLSGGYKFPELEKLTQIEKDILLDSTVILFLEHYICFRETDPLNGRTYLVFPELINLIKPQIGEDAPTEDGVGYTISGSIENVYASLVVLMGYTQTFTRTNQWRNHARYEVATGEVCGFRQEAERDGELDIVLYFGMRTTAPVRMLFQSLFESFLARHNLTARRYEPVICTSGHPLNRAVVREQMSNGAEFTFCYRCGEKISLPKADQPILLTKRQAYEMETNRQAAGIRSRFEQALFRLKNYVADQNIAVPDCFISYAWGDPEHERWVEKSLATDLQKAGITVVLDRWENTRIGMSVPRFVERVGKTDKVIVVGTPLYRKKYDNNDPMRNFIVAAEGDLIGNRMIRAEIKKESVLPVGLTLNNLSNFLRFRYSSTWFYGIIPIGI
jgi:small GTP-binding protein